MIRSPLIYLTLHAMRNRIAVRLRRIRQPPAQEQDQHEAHEQEEQAGQRVLQADGLVIERNQPH